MSRAAAIRRHALRRARERLDHLPDKDTIYRICRLIRRRLRRPEGRPLTDCIIESPTSRFAQRIIATVYHEGRRYRVVYEPATNLIVTWLPVE